MQGSRQFSTTFQRESYPAARSQMQTQRDTQVWLTSRRRLPWKLYLIRSSTEPSNYTQGLPQRPTTSRFASPDVSLLISIGLPGCSPLEVAGSIVLAASVPGHPLSPRCLGAATGASTEAACPDCK